MRLYNLIPQALFAATLVAGCQAKPPPYPQPKHPPVSPPGASGPTLDPAKIRSSVKSHIACKHVDIKNLRDPKEAKRI